MKKEKMLELLSEAARQYASRKKVASQPETQFKKGALWLWQVLMEAKDAAYYEETLRQDVKERIGEVEPWQESLISETARLMAERDEMMAEIIETGRLITKFSKNGDPYQESNPLYVHKKELDRTIGMQREHLGLSFKVNPKRITETAKKGVDTKRDALSKNLENAKREMVDDIPEMDE